VTHEKLQLVLRVRDDRRAHVEEDAKITLSWYEELHVYYLWQNGVVVAINAAAHEVYQTKHELPCVVLEAPEALAALYARNHRTDETETGTD
jgi:hypothetical protein